MLEIFFRVKRRGYLEIAMGLWKISLIKAEMKKSSVKYSKAAGAQLMVFYI